MWLITLLVARRSAIFIVVPRARSIQRGRVGLSGSPMFPFKRWSQWHRTIPRDQLTLELSFVVGVAWNFHAKFFRRRKNRIFCCCITSFFLFLCTFVSNYIGFTLQSSSGVKCNIKKLEPRAIFANIFLSCSEI